MGFKVAARPRGAESVPLLVPGRGVEGTDGPAGVDLGTGGDLGPEDKPLVRARRVRRPLQRRTMSSSVFVKTASSVTLKATAVTPVLWVKGIPIGLPVPASQSRAVRSPLPVSTIRPSELNATEWTGPWWRRGRLMGWRVRADQTCTVPSAHPVRSRVPSGLMATERMVYSCRSGGPSGRIVAASRT